MLEDELGITWGLFQQKVRTPPGTYEVQVWVRVEGGYAFLWVEGLDAQSKVLWGKREYAPCSHRLNPLVPNFVPAAYMLGGDDWHLLRLTVTVQEPAKRLNVKFGSYFMPGRMWFDDVAIKRVESTHQPNAK